jgi:hypothetical protein
MTLVLLSVMVALVSDRGRDDSVLLRGVKREVAQGRDEVLALAEEHVA